MTATGLLIAMLLAPPPPKAGPPPPMPPPEPPPMVSASTSGSRLTVVGATTSPVGSNHLEVGMGWPGLHASVLHGLSNQLMAGARFTFNFGVEGMVNGVVPGLKLQLLVHFKVWESNKFSLAVRFEPGPNVYFYTSASINNCTFDQFNNVVCARSTSAVVGLALPIGVRFGIVASSAVAVGVSFDMPMWLQFGRTTAVFGGSTPSTTLLVPILTGLGAEYFLQSNLLLSFHLKMGPTLSSGGGPAIFTFEGKLGGAYRF